MLGSIGGDLQEDILNDCVISFFDKYLKGIMEPPTSDTKQIPQSGSGSKVILHRLFSFRRREAENFHCQGYPEECADYYFR